MSSENKGAAVATGAGVVLLTLCAGQFLMALDSSVMNVSIATVAEDLDTTITGIQSAIVLYTLVMAMLMVTGGKVGSMMGRKRAFLLGLIIYCAGSLTTALAPNLTVLLLGWSLLEGIGAALIMPAIVALVAGNFPPAGRPRAYGLVGAAGAIAIAVGPLIGGLATTYASWRWVFAGEVLIGAGILLFSRRIVDAPVESRPHLDLLGSVLWAASMGLIVMGVLKSGEWGWFLPTEGGPVFLGMSPVFWMIVAGLGTLRLFGMHIRRLDEADAEPLFSPSLIDRGLNGGPLMFLFQFIVMMGLFFVVPLFLSVALGLSAIETGIKITPLSLTMLLAAAGVPKFFPKASPRRVVGIGFLAVLVGIIALIGAMDADATASIVTVPMLIIPDRQPGSAPAPTG
jgi:MFS family permease